MKEPYLRPAAPEGAAPAPYPPAHQVEPAGIWHGEVMEVVYDPRRHDVVFLLGAVSPAVEKGLVASGWEHHLSDGANQMWTRDREVLVRTRLDQLLASPDPLRIG